MNILRATTAAICLVGCVACSYRVEIAIANKGKVPLTAIYRIYDPSWNDTGCPGLERVAPKQFAWKSRHYYKRMPYSDESVQYDQATCTIAVRIEPGMAASLGRWSLDDVDVSKLGPIRLESEGGSVEYSGSELLSRIKKHKPRTLWVLTHKPAVAV